MAKRRQILPLIFLGAMLFTGLHCCVLVNANFKPIPHAAVHITAGGEIEPADAPISRSGNVYTFTGNWTKYVLKVERSNIKIDGAGFYIIGNSVEQGIGFYNVHDVSVVNVNIVEVNRGIYLEQCSGLTISDCTVTGGNNGIYLNNSINNEVTDNRLISAFNGITLDHSANNKLQNNSIENSHKHGYGLDFLVTGQSVTDYTNNIDASNTVNGAPIIYWVNHQNEAVPSNAVYVALVNCRGITVENLHITKTQGILAAWTTNSTIAHNYLDLNSNGIHLLYCSDIKIVNNEVWRNSDIEECGDGVRLDYSQFVMVANNKLTDNDNGGVTCNNSSKNQIIGNVIGQNHYNGVNLVGHSDFNLVALNYLFNHTTMSRGAVFIEDSKNNTIAANNFTHNGCWAIQFKGNQRDNLIYANNFQNNSYYNTRYTVGALQVSTPGTENANTWQHNGKGNYWSDYTGSDSNSDGIGDTPYFINPNNIDNYPVMTAIDTSNVPLDIKEISLLAPEFSLWNLPVIIVAVMIIAAMGILFKRKNTC